jgi:transcriptional regulator with XRE-family HTH domain
LISGICNAAADEASWQERAAGQEGGDSAMEGQDSRPNVIAERLDHLIATVHEPGRGPYTLREISNGVSKTTGEVVSVQYLSQLRLGQRTKPSYSKLKAVSAFFGVDVNYFSEDSAAQQTDEQLEGLAAMRDASVLDVALRVNGLSEKSLLAVRAMIDSLRGLEGLPATDAPAGDSGKLPPAVPLPGLL